MLDVGKGAKVPHFTKNDSSQSRRSQDSRPFPHQFDTVLKRASAQRRGNFDYARPDYHSVDMNTPYHPQPLNIPSSSVTNELLKIQRERTQFQAEKEAWAQEKAGSRRRDMEALKRERDRLLEEREGWQVKSN